MMPRSSKRPEKDEAINYEPVLCTVIITQNDFDMLKIIRGYFGKNDVTGLEHMAYAVLDRIIKQHENPNGT